MTHQDSDAEAIAIFRAALTANGKDPLVTSCARQFAVARQHETRNPLEKALERCRWQPLPTNGETP